MMTLNRWGKVLHRIKGIEDALGNTSVLNVKGIGCLGTVGQTRAKNVKNAT